MAYVNPKIKNFKVDYNQMEREESQNILQFRSNCLSKERAVELLAMACEDICPNAEYSDFECEVWHMFRMVLRHEM